MKKDLDRATVLRLAALSGLDVRTVRRALEKGLGSLRSEATRAALRAAAVELGVKLQA